MGALERASTKGTANKNRLMECGVGHCFAGALRASAALVRSCHEDATSHLHLPHTYPEAVQARRRLWKAILGCQQAQIISQAIESGVIEQLLTDLLPDTVSFDLGQHHVASPFAAYSDSAPLRGEAVTL